MNTRPSPEAAPSDRSPVRIGALVPLTRPGWVEAGRHLLAGLELGVRDVNAAGGVVGRPLELVVRDAAADPQRATAAVDELARRGVTALVGEYHSVVARAAAASADAHELPFLCSSAVLDALTEQPTNWVARLAPAQSRGWRVYAGFLLSTGHRRVAVATQPGVYWAAGADILRDHLTPRGGTVVEFGTRALDAADVCDAVVSHRASALLLLVGQPEPAVPIVKAVRRDQRLAEVLIGAPAGQPEFDEWATLLGDDGAAIPSLRYLPERLTPLGARVEAAVRERLAEAPSFVALEGYDAVAVLADVLRACGADRARVADAWPRVAARGRAWPSRAPAGASGSPACRASACGSGPGRRSKSSTAIRRPQGAFGSFTPAERARMTEPAQAHVTLRVFDVAVTLAPSPGVFAPTPHGLFYASAARVAPGERVIDVGTGSGVLAVAAALAGATHVVATDLDPRAVEAARRHAEINGVAPGVLEGRVGSLFAGAAGPFDVVLANLPT